ncbi:Flavin prenyltransferase [Ascochyta lentis]
MQILQPLRRSCNLPCHVVHTTKSPRQLQSRCISTSQARDQDLIYSTTAPIPPKKRLVIGVTGATGTLYAIRMLEILKALDIETHLIFSKWAIATMKYETERSFADIASLATKYYAMKDMAAAPSSGSFLHDGMIIVPCSMKTLAAIRSGFCDDLISRSADVCLKERRKLLLAVRETPLSAIHLDNMAFLERAGATIFPPVPAFYTRPKTLEDLIDQSVGRMLDNLGIHVETFKRWDGFNKL